MSGTTMSFSLPESMREYIDERVRTGHYGNTSEYLRDLVRRDQDERARQQAGSPRVGDLCGVPGLRAWAVRGYPVHWYYLVSDERLAAGVSDTASSAGAASPRRVSGRAARPSSR
jgi:antitoxin ParD1/3/4